MGFISDLFSNKQQTKQQNTSNQSGTSNTQNNAWGQIAPYLQQYLGQYSPANISGTGTPNSTQSIAAANQTGVADPSTLAAGTNAATGVANNGLTPSQIQSFMSPYVQSVVDPTIQAQNLQNQQAISNLRGNQAARGALGNNTGSEAAYLAGVQPAQQAQIAGLYNQGYNTAANTALSSNQLQLQGAGTLGQLSNAGTTANNALYNIGQGLFGTSLTPYSLYNQGVSGLTGLGGLAGANTQSIGTGTSSGTANTSQSPSLGSILLGGLGTLFSGFESGGTVHGKEEDSKVQPFHEKVATSFDVLHKLKKKAEGGSVDPIETGWATTVTPASSSISPFSGQRMGRSMVTLANDLSGTDAAPVPQMNAYGAAPGQAGRAVSGFMDMMKDLNGIRGYDDGGAVSSSPLDTVSDYVPSMDTVKSYLPSYSTGVWAGEKPSSMQRFGSALAQVGNGPFAPFGKALMDQQQTRYQDIAAQQAAQRIGLEGRQVSLAEAKNPAEIAQITAQANLARVNADKNFLLDIEKQKAQYAKELELAKMRAQYEMVNGIMNPQGAQPAAPAPSSSTYRTPDGKTWSLGDDGNYHEVQ